MRMTPLLLLISAAAWSPLAGAAPTDLTAHHSWRLELDESQQEVLSSGFSLYTPSLGYWGQVGIYYGNKDYEQIGTSGRMDTISNSELALAWRFATPIADRFNLATTIRGGKSSYKMNTSDSTWHNYGFLEVQFLPTIEVIEPASAWISRIDIGAGVGSRSNFIGDDQRNVGTTRIPGAVIYPELDVALEI